MNEAERTWAKLFVGFCVMGAVVGILMALV